MRKIVLAVLVLVAVALGGEPITFAIIGDRTGDHQDSVHEKIIAEVAKAKPEFVITVGDHIEGYQQADTMKLAEEWAECKSIVASLTMPFYYTPGNHDITYDNALGTYERNVGKPYYSFDYKNMHFIVLDVSRWEASDKLPPEQLDWLAADLGTTRKVRFTFVFFHKPFWAGTVGEGKPDTLHSLFRKYGVDAEFGGHFHQYFGTTIDGIKYTAIGSSGGATEPGPTGILYQWAMVTVDDKRGIIIEPVLLGGEKRAWDDVTLADIQSVDRNALAGLRFREPALVNSDLTAAATVTLVVRNQPLDTPLEDTLRWEVPEGWTIVPAEVAVDVAPGAEAEYQFLAICSGRPYPAPQATLRFPYAKGKTCPVKGSLRAARTAECNLAGKPPVIDGVVNEKCWQNSVTRFFGPDGVPAETDSGKFYFAYDMANLYLAAVCHDPAVNTVKAQAQGRDGTVYNDDCVGYFIQPDTSKGELFQVYFNPAGIVFDQKITVDENGAMQTDQKWDGDYTVKTARGKGLWSIEVMMPIPKDLLTLGPGSVMGLNFRRKQPGRKANADWQPVSYDPHGLGLLLLK